MCSYKYQPSDNSRKRAPRARPVFRAVRAIARTERPAVHPNLLFTYQSLHVRSHTSARRESFSARCAYTAGNPTRWRNVESRLSTRPCTRDTRERKFLVASETIYVYARVTFYVSSAKHLRKYIARTILYPRRSNDTERRVVRASSRAFPNDYRVIYYNAINHRRRYDARRILYRRAFFRRYEQAREREGEEVAPREGEKKDVSRRATSSADYAVVVVSSPSSYSSFTAG